MRLSQAERSTLLLAGNPSVLGLALCHDTHIWMMPSPCPCQRNSLGKGSPKARLGIAALPQPVAAAWRKAVDRLPSAYTAPKPLPYSAGWLINTSRSMLQKACPYFTLPSTSILVWVPDHAKGPQRWFVAESWCSSLNLP